MNTQDQKTKASYKVLAPFQFSLYKITSKKSKRNTLSNFKDTKVSIKLKKKFRYWRLFRNSFLAKKKAFFFIKSRSFYNLKRTIKHQFSYVYGVSFKSIGLTVLNLHFLDFIINQELKLYIVIVRSFLCSNIHEAFKQIRLNLVSVNSSIVPSPHASVMVGSIIIKCRNALNRNVRVNKYSWRRQRWYKARNKLKRYSKARYMNPFFLFKKSLILNYMEVNINARSTIVIKRPICKEAFFGYNTNTLSVIQLKELFMVI